MFLFYWTIGHLEVCKLIYFIDSENTCDIYFDAPKQLIFHKFIKHDTLPGIQNAQNHIFSNVQNFKNFPGNMLPDVL